MELRLLLKNAVALGAASVLNKAISAIVGILVTRYLGKVAFGQYSTAYAFVNMFILLTELGISQLMVQEGSRNPKVLPVYMGNTLVFKACAGALVYVLMLVFMGPAGYDAVVQSMIVILGITVAFNALNASFYNYFQAKQQMYKAAGYQFLSTFLIGFFTLVVLFTDGTVVMITWVHLAVTVFITLLLYWAIRHDAKLVLDLKRLPRMLLDGLGFGIARIFYNVYFQIGILMLSLMVTQGEVGIFSAAYRLVSILVFIPSILTSVVYPILFQLGVMDEGRHRGAIEKMFKVLSAVGIPGSLLLFVLADPIVHWLYADQYAESVPVLRLLCWFFMLECLSFSLGDVLSTTNRQWKRTWIQGIATAINVLANLLLIPVLGIYGAAWGTLVTELFILVAYYAVVRKHVYHVRVLRQLPVVVGASLAMGAVAFALREFHPLISASAAGGVYLVLLIAFERDFKRIAGYLWQQRLVRLFKA